MNTHDTLKAMLATVLLLAGMSEAGAGQPYKTGQQSTWDEYGNTIYGKGTGQDGEHQMGKIKKKRFKLKRKKGYIYDQWTHLKWYYDPSCLYTVTGGGYPMGDTHTEALQKVKDMNKGIFPNDPDGKCVSKYKDWRLPNVKEAQSLGCYSVDNELWNQLKRITNGKAPYGLWTSTTCADQPTKAFATYINNVGETMCIEKYRGLNYPTWPVRGGK